MLIILKNSALISGINEVGMDEVKKYLTINNPLFFKKMDLGLSTWDIPQSVEYFEQVSDETIDVPIGAASKVFDILMKNGNPISKDDIFDQRVTNVLPEYFSKLKFKGKLRSYQQEIVDSCMPKTLGVVEAMTASGKTITFVALTLLRKEATLILVHTIELARQTLSAFKEFTNLKVEDIGFIGDGRFEVKPITVGLHQTLAKMNPDKFELLNGLIGQVIGDEIHIIAAETWYRTVSQLKAKYKFGFSATPKREDGLTKVIHFASGPKIHTVEREKLKNVLITPDVRYINTIYSFPMISSQEYVELINDLSADKERNALILRTHKTDYAKRPTVFLCNRKVQVEYLAKHLGKDAVFLHSKMKKNDRKETMKLLKEGKKTMVVSTYGLFATGIDLPRLEILFLCAPIRSEVKLTQAAGRLMRKAPGKTSATIVDFVDVKVEMLRIQGFQRKRIFKKL